MGEAPFEEKTRVVAAALEVLARAVLADDPTGHEAALQAAQDQVDAAEAWQAFTVMQVVQCARFAKELAGGAEGFAQIVAIDRGGNHVDIDAHPEMRGTTAAVRALAAAMSGDSPVPFLALLTEVDDIRQATDAIDGAWQRLLRAAAEANRGDG